MSGAVLFSTTEENIERWTGELRRNAPDLDLRIWPDVGRIEDIEFAIVARPPRGDLARYPNLKAIFSMWAGVEDLLSDSSIGSFANCEDDRAGIDEWHRSLCRPSCNRVSHSDIRIQASSLAAPVSNGVQIAVGYLRRNSRAWCAR